MEPLFSFGVLLILMMKKSYLYVKGDCRGYSWMAVHGTHGRWAKPAFRGVQSYLSDPEVLLSDYLAILNGE